MNPFTVNIVSGRLVILGTVKGHISMCKTHFVFVFCHETNRGEAQHDVHNNWGDIFYDLFL